MPTAVRSTLSSKGPPDMILVTHPRLLGASYPYGLSLDTGPQPPSLEKFVGHCGLPLNDSIALLLIGYRWLFFAMLL